MRFLDRFSVAGKLALSTGCLLVLLVGLGGFAVWQLAHVYGQTESIMGVRLPGVRDSLRMAEAASRLRVREYRFISSSPDELESVVGKMQQSVQTFEEARGDYAAAIADAHERELYESMLADWKRYGELRDPMIAAMRAGRTDEARQLLAVEGLKRFDKLGASIKELSGYNTRMAEADTAAARKVYESGRAWVAGMCVLALAVSVGLSLRVSRSITRPLNYAVGVTEAVACGDLTREVRAAGRDEVAQLMRALGAMVVRLREVVGEVRGGVESVSTASAQIATGNLDLSQRTEEQASNLQQTAASMEQLTATVKHNADTARQAAALATQASGAATSGGEVVGQVVATMDEISASSKKIADIIGVIDGIAFQTNILALNAAVEAARAGEQGRGFAVVAGEVRSLAQRSANAAKEIKNLIGHSVEKVDGGARLVAQAGEAMAGIVQQVRKVTDLVGEISHANLEQTSGIEQIGHAVQQLDQVTQQNAALVEESAAAAENMKRQAERLAEVVSVFQVGRPAALAA
ncbi:MAG: HAMP domain-containing protein [Aquabacterium sp.]|nr:MAG: HAMP domain-containing protein [Aquabacterium sp.]